MYATLLQHRSILGDVTNCITWLCKWNSATKERSPAPPAPPAPPQVPPPRPTHRPVHVLGSGPGPSLTRSFSYPESVMPASSENQCFQSSMTQAKEWRKIKEMYVAKIIYAESTNICIELSCRQKGAEKTKGPSTPHTRVQLTCYLLQQTIEKLLDSDLTMALFNNIWLRSIH